MDDRRTRQVAECESVRAACGTLRDTAERAPVLWPAAIMAARLRAPRLPQFDKHCTLRHASLFEALRCLIDDEYGRTLSLLAADVCLAWRRLCTIAESPTAVQIDYLALYHWLKAEEHAAAAATSAEIGGFLGFVTTKRAAGRLLRIALSSVQIRLWQTTDAPLMAVRDALSAVRDLGRDELDSIPRSVPSLLESLKCSLSKSVTLRGGHDAHITVAAFLAVRAKERLLDQRIIAALGQWNLPAAPRLHVTRTPLHLGQVGSARPVEKSLQEWLELVAPPPGVDPDVLRDARALGVLQRHQMK